VTKAALFCALAGLSLCGNPSLAAEPLGRLFFTPAQRAQLDAARNQKKRAAVTGTISEEAAPLPEILTYGGVVRRSDGKSTVWLNNRAVDGREAAAGTVAGQIRADGTLTLRAPQADRRVELKVGQSMEVGSGVIEEPYARRVTAPRPKAAPSDKAVPGAPSAQEKTANAPSDAVLTGKAAGKDLVESKVEGVVERLRSLRKEQGGNGQDNR